MMQMPALQTRLIIYKGERQILAFQHNRFWYGKFQLFKQKIFYSVLLYVKLFILMGGTWLMEFISWVVGGPQEYWIFTDLINCSRGFLIFIVCVAYNARVRGSLLNRVMRKNYQAGGIDQEPPIESFATAIEFINLKNETEAQSPKLIETN